MRYLKLFKLNNQKKFGIVVTNSKSVKKGFVLEKLGVLSQIGDSSSYILDIDRERLDFWCRSGVVVSKKLKYLLNKNV